MINKNLVIAQKDVKRRYSYYKRGGQQGLGMIWDNIMKQLKEQYQSSKK